jgi:hypothetical protein
MTAKPRAPSSRTVARRFKSGESVEEIARALTTHTCYDDDVPCDSCVRTTQQQVEDALRRAMLKQEKRR